AGEPDRTPLLTYEAFSPRIASKRLEYLAGDIELPLSPDLLQRCDEKLRSELSTIGLPLRLVFQGRPGTSVSLDDAVRVLSDIRVPRPRRASLEEFLTAFDFSPLAR